MFGIVDNDSVVDEVFWIGVVVLDSVEVYCNYFVWFLNGIYWVEVEEMIVEILVELNWVDCLIEEVLEFSCVDWCDIQRNLIMFDYDICGIDGIFGFGFCCVIINW